MISIKNLNFSYPGSRNPSLSNLNLEVSSQSLFGLLGSNGAGKSTLLSILSGLLRCETNCVFINGRDIAVHRNSRKQLGFSLVPQEYAFYNSLTVRENLNFFGTAHGQSATALKLQIEKVSYTTGLQNHLLHRAENLSGGLKRRLNLAIGLLSEPSLLLLDEPTVGIDSHSRYFILETIRHLNLQGTTVLYTSHYLEEVENLCDQVAIIDHGKVLLQNSMTELLQTDSKRKLSVELIEPINTQQLEELQLNWPLEHENKHIELCLDSEKDIPEVLNKFEQKFIRIKRIQYGTHTLEELFLNLTQTSLRDT